MGPSPLQAAGNSKLNFLRFGIFIPLVGGIIGALYMLLRDAMPIEALEYQSIGKKLLKLSVANTKDPAAKVDYIISAKRNWMFALGPIMLFFLFIPIIGWIIDILLGIAVLILVRHQGICKRLTIIKESIS